MCGGDGVEGSGRGIDLVGEVSAGGTPWISDIAIVVFDSDEDGDSADEGRKRTAI